MLKWFLECTHCREGLTHLSCFPICAICHATLVTCPPLCPSCASPRCLQSKDSPCLFPWRKRDFVHSYSSRYLLVGEGLHLLRTWKKRSGYYFDGRILRSHAVLSDTWRNFRPDAIIAIPQRPQRSWQMRGSRAEQIARWVSRQTGAPLVRALTPGPRTGPRQAQLDLSGRLENRIQFSTVPKATAGLKRVILVDDFMTTGKTLHSAAQHLAQREISQIHIFCLGYRPPRLRLEKEIQSPPSCEFNSIPKSNQVLRQPQKN